MASKPKFDIWLHEVRRLAQDDGITDVNVDEELARGYWRDGYSPKSFYNENTLFSGPDADTDDFDPGRDI